MFMFSEKQKQKLKNYTFNIITTLPGKMYTYFPLRIVFKFKRIECCIALIQCNFGVF